MQFENWDAARQLLQLDELALREIDVEEKHFAGLLENLSGLTALEIVCMPFSARVVDCIFAMSKLRTLTYKPFWMPRIRICRSTRTRPMHLTKLSCAFSASLLQMMCLTKIKHFEVFIRGRLNSGEGLVRALESMPNLQFLRIHRSDGKELLVPSYPLDRMTKLKVLDLRGVYSDSAFYQSLATLPELTELRVSIQPITTMPVSHSEINLLTNLNALRILGTCLSGPDDLLNSLSGQSLKRLQTLVVLSADLNSRRRAALFRRLPSLRHFSVCSGSEEFA